MALAGPLLPQRGCQPAVALQSVACNGTGHLHPAPCIAARPALGTPCLLLPRVDFGALRQSKALQGEGRGGEGRGQGSSGCCVRGRPECTEEGRRSEPHLLQRTCPSPRAAAVMHHCSPLRGAPLQAPPTNAAFRSLHAQQAPPRGRRRAEAAARAAAAVLPHHWTLSRPSQR